MLAGAWARWNTHGFVRLRWALALQALTTFNGDGTATASATLMTATTGPNQFISLITYTLDSICTGTLTSVRSTGQTTHYVIAVTDGASHVHFVATDAGGVVAGTLERVMASHRR